MCGGFGSWDGDAKFTRLKAALDLSVRDFQRSFYAYRKLFWQMPVLRRCISENRRVGGLLMRIGDANFTQLNTPLDLSRRRFQRRFYTYRRRFWQAPVVRRCLLENRMVWRLWTRIGTVDSDANSTGLKAPLDLSIRRFQRRLIHIDKHLGQCRCPDDASSRARGVAAVVANGRCG
jgi:hypothetical protein